MHECNFLPLKSSEKFLNSNNSHKDIYSTTENPIKSRINWWGCKGLSHAIKYLALTESYWIRNKIESFSTDQHQRKKILISESSNTLKMSILCPLVWEYKSKWKGLVTLSK